MVPHGCLGYVVFCVFALPAVYTLLEGRAGGKSILWQGVRTAIWGIAIVLLYTLVNTHLPKVVHEEYATHPFWDEKVSRLEMSYRASSVLPPYDPLNLGDMNADSFWHVKKEPALVPDWVIIDLGPGNEYAVNTLSARPRPGHPTNFWRDARLEGSKEGINFEEIAILNQEDPPEGKEWITWYFQNEKPYRYYRLWITSGHDMHGQFFSFSNLVLARHNPNIAAHKEYASYPLTDKKISRLKMSYKASSFLPPYDPSNLGDIDKGAFTFWHIKKEPVLAPDWVIIDLGPGNEYAVNTLSARPRPGCPINFWKDARLEGSADGINFEEIASVNQKDPPPPKKKWIRWYFQNEKPYRYYRLWITSGHYTNSQFVSFSDIVLARCDPNVPWGSALAGWLTGIFILIAGNLTASSLRSLLEGYLNTGYFWSALSKAIELVTWPGKGRHSENNFYKEIFFLSVVILCYLIPLKDVLVTQKQTFIHDGILDYGAYHYFIESLWNGYWPLWNPYLHAGEPFYYYWGKLAFLDPSVLFPVVISSFFRPSIHELYHYIFILRTLILIAGTYLLLRRIFTYALSTYVSLAILLLGPMTCIFFTSRYYMDSFLWFPWILYLVIRLVEGGGIREIAYIAFLVGVSSGTPRYQWPLMLLALTVFTGLILIKQREGLVGVLRRQKPVHLGLCLLLVVCLCAPMIPLREETDKIFVVMHNLMREPNFTTKSFLYPPYYTVNSEPISNLVRIFLPVRKLIPLMFDRVGGDYVVGIIPILLFWVGMFFGRNRFKSNFFVLMVVMALVTLGVGTVTVVLVRIFFPLMKFVYYWQLSTSFVLLTLGFFAGLGVDAIVSMLNRSNPYAGCNDRGEDPKAYRNLPDASNWALRLNAGVKPFIALFLTLVFITLNQTYVKTYQMNFPEDIPNVISAILTSLLITFVAYLLVKAGFSASHYIYRVYSNEACQKTYYGFPAAMSSILNWSNNVRTLVASSVSHSKTTALFRISRTSLAMLTVICIPYIYECIELPYNYFLWLLCLECLLLTVIFIHYLAERYEISLSSGLLLILFIGVCVEMSMVYGIYRQYYFRPRQNINFSIYPQEPQLSNRIPALVGPQYGPIGRRFRPNLYKINTAIDEILYPKGKPATEVDDICYERAYGPLDTVNQTYSFWLKQYLSLYEIGESSIATFEELMGLRGGQTPFDFYSQIVIKSTEDTNTLFLRPEIAPVLASAVFVPEPLPEGFKSLEIELEGVDPERPKPSLGYRVLRYNPNHIEVEINVDHDGLLHFRDGYDNHWRAYIDGKRTAVYRANLAFKAVPVRQGRHTVVFDYCPVFFVTAFRVYLLAVIAFLGFLAYDVIRKWL